MNTNNNDARFSIVSEESKNYINDLLGDDTVDLLLSRLPQNDIDLELRRSNVMMASGVLLSALVKNRERDFIFQSRPFTISTKE